MSKLGIALSGGGAKGAAHIGVLQALHEANIKVDLISGTSSGSIIASLYAAGYEPYDILKIFNAYCTHIADYDKMLPFKLGSVFFKGRINIKGFVKGDKLENTLYKYFKYKNVANIRDIKMPLAIPTVDLNTGEVIYYLSQKIDDSNNIIKYNGNLSSIVRASSSFPGVFEPKILDKRILVDGGVVINTPVNILKKMGADKVIAVCFDSVEKVTNINIITIAMKSFDIMENELTKVETKNADFIIAPKLLKVSLLECDKTLMIANAGYFATKDKIEEIKKLL